MNQIVKHKIYSPLAIRNRAMEYASRPEPQEVSKGRRGAVIGELSQSMTVALNLYQDREGNRIQLTPDQKDMINHVSRLVCSWLFLAPSEVFAPMSRTELTPQMVNGLGRWMSEYKDGEYVQRFTFRDELTWVIHWAKTAYDWSVEAASKGDKLLFADILARYQKESIVGGGQEADDHWELHSFNDYVEMKYNEMQEQPPALFPGPHPQEAPGAILPDETVKDMGTSKQTAECDFFDF